MKRGFYFGLLIMLGFSLMSSMCSNDDDGGSPNNNAQQIAQIVSTAESGSWRITNFNDSGQNETSDFTGYAFTFNPDGSLIATNGTDSLTGTWSVTNDSNSSDDSSSDNDIDFNIFFPVAESNNFEDLNDDWDITSVSSTRIELIDISGGNGGTDILIFEKN
jgi:hypothetical protein